MVGELDIAPARVRGAIVINRGRVIYDAAASKLYVARMSKRVTVYSVLSMTMQPGQAGQGHRYTATLAGVETPVTFNRDGCSSCGFTLGRVDRAALINVAKVYGS